MCVELFSLRDKVALVTDAGKGLGKSMALALSESGAHVVALLPKSTRKEIIVLSLSALNGYSVVI